MIATTITERFHRHSMDACESKAEEIAAECFACDGANIGGRRSGRWPFLHNIEGQDFNTTPLAADDGQYSFVVCEQVIEHLHNTTFFLSELYRITARSGHLLLSTENLASIPNIGALMLGIAPFSTQAICGEMVGGFKHMSISPELKMDSNHPCFSGMRGHVRVMTAGQLRTLLQRAGFAICGQYSFGLNHYILFHCVK